MKTQRFLISKRNGLNPIPFSLGLTFIFLLSCFSVSAQSGSTNFSGNWVFNESKSSQAEGGFRFAPSKLVVNHTGTNLDVSSTSNGPNGEMATNSKFTTDGKECSNAAFGDNVRKSIVKWSDDGKSLVFSHTMSFNMDGQNTEFKTTETWKINPDNTLAVESVFNSPNGEMKSTNVYDKK